MLALSVRQPFAELILRGIKTAEYRTRPTRIIGRRFYIYASKSVEVRGQRSGGRGIWSRQLRGDQPPDWMIELAEQMKMIEPGAIETLPRGLIVGSAVIERCVRRGEPCVRPACEMRGGEHEVRPCIYQWHLADIRRIEPRKPARKPQPVWFEPF